ncbi:acyl-coenzyme A thioesterase THEM4 isoform X1 [Rousettus aegyptiacus]|uniref:Acyl-coenzyme A thioesterase THEM4 n=1 Tax=Rousettus aegyptiacus TaxID=9407 RepID=A0A7J8BIC6_ROUAE|nr:acyl-coenzyme A thioesterase THEM4 isoform X1 [Rousettus aegyptiacus]KAF6398215.1 thioesterase superfamily member 4 [Rousettus aegyptiacus]
MLSSCGARLRALRALCRDASAPARNPRPALRSFSSEKDPTPLSSSWSEELRLLSHQFMKKCDNGSWTLIPPQVFHDLQYQAYRTFQNSKLMKGRQVSTTLFLARNFQEILGFEYALFYNKDERRVVCFFQGGPLLQGFPGLLHGGATATLIDSIMAILAVNTMGFIMTTTLNITYKRPIAIGSVVVLNIQVDKIEGKKVFLSCSVRSADEKILYSEATSLYIKLDLEKRLT